MAIMPQGTGRTVRTSRNSYSSAFEFDEPGGGFVRTPKPHQADTADEKIVLQLIGALRHHAVNPNRIAADMMTQDVHVQEQLSQLVFACLGSWAEMADCTQSSHPLRHVYDTSRKMVDSLFV